MEARAVHAVNDGRGADIALDMLVGDFFLRGYPNHVVEVALAHAVGDKMEAAYRRSDLFGKRQRLNAGLSSKHFGR